jgi:hypothetical protein
MGLDGAERDGADDDATASLPHIPLVEDAVAYDVKPTWRAGSTRAPSPSPSPAESC